MLILKWYLGSINAIDPLIGPSRTVQVQAVLPNTDNKLKAGMFARVPLPLQIVLWY